MRALLYSHEACLLHDNGRGHPERAERIPAAVAGVRASGVDLVEREAPAAPIEALYPVHDPGYVRAIEQACAAGGKSLDPDTAVVPESWEAALRAAGSGLAAIDALRAGEADAAFLAVRPPGHHALNSRAMGFCLFNNVAVAAQAITAAGERVAILDWDVHHGNGSQDAFYEREDIVYVSLHQFPFYPGTGWVDEAGRGAGAGHTVNIPLPAGSGGEAIRTAVESIVAPILGEFDPDWLLVSAGYDAHAADPLAELRYEARDYGWLARELASGRRSIVFLEGGYDLEAVTASVEATMRGLAGEAFSVSSGGFPPGAERMIAMAAEQARLHWSGVQAD
ncbi:MAG: histone deacetylase [Acidimicrobiia bacterium]